MWSEFKNFAFKGNAFDLAVGVIMGGAFGNIVNSVVNDLLMPVIGVITGGVDFTQKFMQLAGGAPKDATLAAAKEAGSTLAYGSFITTPHQLPDHRLLPLPAGEDLEPHEEGRAAGTAAARLHHGHAARGNPRRAQEEVSISRKGDLKPGCWTPGLFLCMGEA